MQLQAPGGEAGRCLPSLLPPRAPFPGCGATRLALLRNLACTFFFLPVWRPSGFGVRRGRRPHPSSLSSTPQTLGPRSVSSLPFPSLPLRLHFRKVRAEKAFFTVEAFGAFLAGCLPPQTELTAAHPLHQAPPNKRWIWA